MRHNHSVDDLLEKFRRCPTPLFVMHIGAKTIFSFGLGAVLAAPRNSPWRMIGWLTMALGALISLPLSLRLLRR